MDKALCDKDENIKQLEEHVKRVDAQLDHIEQYRRWSSFRVTGIKEHDDEDNDRIVINLIDDMNVQDMNINNINRMHRVRPRHLLTNKHHARQIIIQFKDYRSKTTSIKARKTKIQATVSSKNVEESMESLLVIWWDDCDQKLTGENRQR